MHNTFFVVLMLHRIYLGIASDPSLSYNPTIYGDAKANSSPVRTVRGTEEPIP